MSSKLPWARKQMPMMICLASRRSSPDDPGRDNQENSAHSNYIYCKFSRTNAPCLSKMITHKGEERNLQLYTLHFTLFIPLPFETYGGLHEKSISTISKISRALSSHSGKPPSEVTSHLFQRLGVLLAKGNSALILSRAPKSPSSDLDGDQDT